jgi:hypothetical protein
VTLSGGSGASDAGTDANGPSADAGSDRIDAGGAAPDARDGATGGTDPARYNFETGTQSWASSGAPLASVATSNARAFAGANALAVTFNGNAGSASAFVRAPAAAPGSAISFRIWIPSGSGVASVQPYVLQGSAGGWAWTGAWRAASSLTANAWNTITVTVPANAKTPLDQLGVEFATNQGASATAYVDSVTW